MKKFELMKNIRHIHDVLQLLFTSEKKYTVETLHEELRIRFGNDAQFSNCADNVFPIREVVPFILSRGKIRMEDDTIIPLTPGCDH